MSNENVLEKGEIQKEENTLGSLKINSEDLSEQNFDLFNHIETAKYDAPMMMYGDPMNDPAYMSDPTFDPGTDPFTKIKPFSESVLIITRF